MESIIHEGRTRREFLKGAGAVMAGGVVIGVVGSQLSCEELPGVANWWTPDSNPLAMAPQAAAYLVHDTNKCASCIGCMVACSTAKLGKSNTSLARLQRVFQNFDRYPQDIEMMECRQCAQVPCIEVCPSGAFHTDPDNGNVRTINTGTCADYQASIAPAVCRLCIENCPYTPSMAIWNHEIGGGIEGVAMVCDLCKDTPYWNQEGGVDGKQACVEACNMGAIALIKQIPSQFGIEGYDVNLIPVEED